MRHGTARARGGGGQSGGCAFTSNPAYRATHSFSRAVASNRTIHAVGGDTFPFDVAAPAIAGLASALQAGNALPVLKDSATGAALCDSVTMDPAGPTRGTCLVAKGLAPGRYTISAALRPYGKGRTTASPAAANTTEFGAVTLQIAPRLVAVQHERSCRRRWRRLAHPLVDLVPDGVHHGVVADACDDAQGRWGIR